MEIIKRQKYFFEKGYTIHPKDRKKALKKLKQCLRKNKGILMKAMKEDLGRHSYETFMAEYLLVMQNLKYTVRNINRWTRKKIIFHF